MNQEVPAFARRESGAARVPIRTGRAAGLFCEGDMVAHGGTSVAGSFIQTLTMVDVATGWTEWEPLVTRDGSLVVVDAINRAQSLFPWLLRGVDFDNDSAFTNDVVVPWCRGQKLEVTRSRAYKKNDQAFVEQKNGAVARRLMGYSRFDGLKTAHLMARLYAAARLYVQFFPVFDRASPSSAGLSERYPEQFGMRQHSIVQRLLKRRSGRRLPRRSLVRESPVAETDATPLPQGAWTGRAIEGPFSPPAPPIERASKAVQARSISPHRVSTTAPPARRG